MFFLVSSDMLIFRLFYYSGSILSVWLQLVKVSSIAAFSFSSLAYSGAWVGPNDAQLRHHLQLLADQGIIKTPVTSWPLNWSNIQRDLSNFKQFDAPDSLSWSYQYVNFELERHSRVFSAALENHASTAPNTFTKFGDNQFDERQISADLDILYNNFTIGLNGSFVSDPLDNQKARLDGSHLAVLFENWVFGVGAIDRWWGPGWSNGLILSNNARPAPGLFIRRNYDDATDWPVFEWLGPWQFDFFVNQLEDERNIPEAKLYGYRTSYRPASFFEFGFARIIFDGADESNIDEPELGWSEHLGSFDARLSIALGNFTHGVYFELVGQADDIYKIEEEVGLLGYELSLSKQDSSHRLVFEYANTTAGAIKSDEELPGVAYTDTVYQSGYHFRGRNLGAFQGADSELISVRGLHFHATGWELEWQWINGDLNTSDSENHSITSEFQEVNYFNILFAKPMSDKLKAEFEVFYLDAALGLDGINSERDLPDFDSGLSLSLRYRY